LVKPEVLGLDPELTGDALYEGRKIALGKQMSQCFVDSTELMQREVLDKQVMKNVLLKKTDWDNNNEFNGGKSANQRYFDEVWGITEDFQELEVRNQAPLKNLKGKFADAVTKAKDEIINNANSVKKGFLETKTGRMTAIGVGIATFGVSAAFTILKEKAKAAQKVVPLSQVLTPQNNTAPQSQVITSNPQNSQQGKLLLKQA